MIESPNPQGSGAWFLERIALPTASNFKRILTPWKLELSKQADDYLNRLLSERFTGEPHDQQDGGVETVWMARGKSLEAEAFAAYALLTGLEPRQCGFCWRDERKRVGCSPDALVGDDGCLEIKSPMLSTHIGWQRGGVVPDDHKLQVYGEIYVTGRQWCDFVSYYPGMPLFVVRAHRFGWLETMDRAITEFCDRLDAEEAKLIEIGYHKVSP